MKRVIQLLFACFAAATAAAQAPLYLVNGTPATDIASINPDLIDRIESLPADEQTIAQYGEEAAHGVILVTLRYDQPAAFGADSTFGNYIARQIEWGEGEPAARMVVRYTITPEGELVVGQTLESTDSRFKRRVLKAVAEAPRWSPATKNGSPIASEGVLSIQLPHGKQMPRQVELIYR